MEEKNLKNVMYILAIVAVLLAGALAYIWYQKSTLVNELTIEKEELTAPALSDSQQNYYLYIMLYPNLSNYDELAMLLLDHMPFQIAFGLKLYVGVHRDN